MESIFAPHKIANSAYIERRRFSNVTSLSSLFRSYLLELDSSIELFKSYIHSQEGVSNLPTSLQTLKELFWNKDIPEITHIDLRHLTNLTELSITRYKDIAISLFFFFRPQGKLILPSSLHSCNITSWRFRFKPDRLVHLSEASNLRELHLKDCYVVSGEFSIEFSHSLRFNELLTKLSDLIDAH